MELRFLLFVIAMGHCPLVKAQNGLMQFLMEQTNFLIFNSSQIIEDTTTFLPSYDFIIVGSGSGGECPEMF